MSSKKSFKSNLVRLSLEDQSAAHLVKAVRADAL